MTFATDNERQLYFDLQNLCRTALLLDDSDVPNNLRRVAHAVTILGRMTSTKWAAIFGDQEPPVKTTTPENMA
jgi:uncharacterized protein (UPF0147 family)